MTRRWAGRLITEASQRNAERQAEQLDPRRDGWDTEASSSEASRDRDDYEPLIAAAPAFSLTGQELEDAVAEVIDVDQWMWTFAMLSLNGNDDVYTRLWEHNFRTYARPEDGKLVAIPWDLDRAFQLGWPQVSRLSRLTPTISRTLRD